MWNNRPVSLVQNRLVQARRQALKASARIRRFQRGTGVEEGGIRWSCPSAVRLRQAPRCLRSRRSGSSQPRALLSWLAVRKLSIVSLSYGAEGRHAAERACRPRIILCSRLDRRLASHQAACLPAYSHRRCSGEGVIEAYAKPRATEEEKSDPARFRRKVSATGNV